MKIIDEELLILVQFYLYREFFEWLFVNKLNFLCLIFWFVEKEIIMLLFDCRLCYTNCLAVSCLYRATEDFILILECSNWTSFQCWKWASEFITLLPWVSVVWNLFGWLDFKEKLTPTANHSSSSHSEYFLEVKTLLTIWLCIFEKLAICFLTDLNAASVINFVKYQAL